MILFHARIAKESSLKVRTLFIHKYLEACDRHIAVCSTIKNRPRPPPTLANILNINARNESKRTISEYKYDS